MSACEACWTKASFRARALGGHQVDHCRDLLREHVCSSDIPDGRGILANRITVSPSAFSVLRGETPQVDFLDLGPVVQITQHGGGCEISPAIAKDLGQWLIVWAERRMGGAS